MNVCRSCKAPNQWAVTARGVAIPLDVEPSSRGTIRLESLSEGLQLRTIVVPEAERDRWVGRLYLAHFATCPYAEEHRRR
jgi:hypothetical protein